MRCRLLPGQGVVMSCTRTPFSRQDARADSNKKIARGSQRERNGDRQRLYVPEGAIGQAGHVGVGPPAADIKVHLGSTILSRTRGSARYALGSRRRRGSRFQSRSSNLSFVSNFFFFLFWRGVSTVLLPYTRSAVSPPPPPPALLFPSLPRV